MANTQFLGALLAADPFDEYHFFLAGERECTEFRQAVASHFPGHTEHIKALPRKGLPAALAENRYHVFHLSDCITHQAQLSRLRNLHAPELFPITGVTHSLSYPNYGQAFLAHLWPGTTPRDCIVATSRTGVQVVEGFFGYLRRGYGLDATRFPQPSIRRIPLAVTPEDLVPASPEEKIEARARLGLTPERTLFLVFGRLSHYSKMDLLPLLRALKRCVVQGMDPASFSLVLAGWVEDGENYHEAVTGLATTLGLDVRVFARPDEAQKADLYHAADVFVSIADNPQETFGITILEAQSAGLAVVASEYDGYRDLVDSGTNGLLVPTLCAAQTPEVDPMARLLFDSDSHLSLAQETVVEVGPLAEALLALHRSPELRLTLGRKARQDIEERYSWSRIIDQYIALWDELWRLPAERVQVAHPMELPYGEVFGHYTTTTLSDELSVSATAYGLRVYRNEELPIIYPGIAGRVTAQGLRKLLFAARKPVSVIDLTTQVSGMLADAGSEAVRGMILWALKHDLLQREES
ncbi:MAG: glycosyltransferase family 4 protein [Proteobacteria bacterium]|nr:glycosyltransferase family 4 protein [Pseudomonadota bacterium]